MVNVMSPDVAGVQAVTIRTPCAPEKDAVLVPLSVIIPVVLVTTSAALPKMTRPTPTEEVPVREIGPLPVAVEIVEAPPVRLIPLGKPARLGPAVPFNVIAPPPFVLILPDPREMPWQVPVVPVEEAVILIELPAPVTEKFSDKENPRLLPPCPTIDEVAVTVPAVMNAEATLIP